MDPKRVEELMAKRVEELGKCRLAVDKASSEKAKGHSINIALLCDVPINAIGKNIVICVYRQLQPFL